MSDRATIPPRRRWPLAAATLAALAVGAAPRSAHADGTPAPASSDAPAKKRVEWNPDWPRFRIWEYAGTAVVGGASIYLYRYVSPPAEPKWHGNNFFDDKIRDWLVADGRDGRESAGQVGNILSWGGAAVPFVIDLPLIALAHRQPGLAWQVLMMDLEAEAVSGFIKNLLFVEAGRARPSFADCAADRNYDALCGSPSNNASFPSGHTANIAVAAGLTCVHHHYLPIYGQPAADAGVCVLLSAATVVTAITRVISDRHFTTDAIAGAALGFGTGYGLPWLLHYRYGGPPGRPGALLATRPVLLPIATGHGLGLGMLWAM